MIPSIRPSSSSTSGDTSSITTTSGPWHAHMKARPFQFHMVPRRMPTWSCLDCRLKPNRLATSRVCRLRHILHYKPIIFYHIRILKIQLPFVLLTFTLLCFLVFLMSLVCCSTVVGGGAVVSVSLNANIFLFVCLCCFCSSAFLECVLVSDLFWLLLFWPQAAPGRGMYTMNSVSVIML